MLITKSTREILHEAKQFTNNGNYAKAYLLLESYIKEFTSHVNLENNTEVDLAFHLHLLWYEAAMFIAAQAESKKILDDLYVWATRSGNELLGRLWLIEHEIRYQEITKETGITLAQKSAQLAKDAFKAEQKQTGVWAANKYFKFLPLIEQDPIPELAPEKILAVAQAEKMPEAELWLQHHFGNMALQKKEFSIAKARFEESLRLSYLLNQTDGIKWNSYNLGLITLEQEHDKQKAVALFAQAVNTAQQRDEQNSKHQQLLSKPLLLLNDHTTRLNRLMLLSKLMASEIHELKNIVAGWQLTLDNLIDELNPQDQHSLRFAGTLKELSAGLRHKLTDLLGLARGQTPQEKDGQINLDQFFENFVTFCRQLTKDHTAQLAYTNHTKEEFLVPIPETVLQQVFLNLILNSLEAAENKPLAMEVVLLKQGETSIIRFSDTGPGISPDVAEHLFQAFYTTKETGTGIGLFTVKTLLQKYGYDICYIHGYTGACFEFKKVEEGVRP
jgi:signal transduction histidine kinase